MFCKNKKGQIWTFVVFLLVFGALFFVALDLSNIDYRSFSVSAEDTYSVDDSVFSEYDVVSRGYVEPTFVNALDSLLLAEDDLVELVESDLTFYLVNDTLNLAKRYFVGDKFVEFHRLALSEEDSVRKEYLFNVLGYVRGLPLYEIEKQDFAMVIKLSNDILGFKYRAYELLDLSDLLEDKIDLYKVDGVNTTLAEDLLIDARFAYNEERYVESEELLKEVDFELENARVDLVRRKSLVRLSRSFLEVYWWQSLLFLFILFLISPYVFRRVRKYKAKNTVKDMELELKSLNRAMKKLQKDYFQKRAIPKSTYDIRMDKFVSRKAEIKYRLPVVKAVAEGKKVSSELKRKWKGLVVGEK
jgi:hypothetical protein